MPLTPDELAQGDRLATKYNTGDWSLANPFGMARVGAGGKGLFVSAVRDFVGYARGVLRVATAAPDGLETVEAQVQAVDDDARAAAASAQTASDKAAAAAASAQSVDGPAIANRFAAVETRTAVLEDVGYRLALLEHFGA